MEEREREREGRRRKRKEEGEEEEETRPGEREREEGKREETHRVKVRNGLDGGEGSPIGTSGVFDYRLSYTLGPMGMESW